jgi:hypothetical protein
MLEFARQKVRDREDNTWLEYRNLIESSLGDGSAESDHDSRTTNSENLTNLIGIVIPADITVKLY